MADNLERLPFITRKVTILDPNAVQAELLPPRRLNRVIKREDFGQYDGGVLPVAGNATSAVSPGGFRIFGLGLDTNDSGMVAITGAPGQRMTTSADTDDMVAIGGNAMLAPDTQGPFRLSTALSFNNAATKSVFCGFVGTAADAMTKRVTSATTVLTLVDDDLVGLHFDTNLDDVDRWFVPHNAADAEATIATTATGVDTGKNVVAASLTLIDVIVNADGSFNWNILDAAGFAAGFLAAATSTVATALAPVLYVAAEGDAVEEMDLHTLELEYVHDNSLLA